jgi:predicted secreted hydrolase
MDDRRRLILSLPLVLLPVRAAAQQGYPRVVNGTRLAFPRDHGSHPAFRVEWWYFTGWIRGGGRDLGFQVTFFRNRPGIGEDNASRFAPTQLLFAHAALADAEVGFLLQDQKAGRAGFGLAQAQQGDTDVHIDDWSLKRTGGAFAARIAAREFALTLDFQPTQAIFLEGEEGYSRKGPLPVQASYYYSWPQLKVSGSIVVKGRALEVEGSAWLDHEWSSEPLVPEASGWDWAGINAADGGALMAFRVRRRDGGVLWAGATQRDSAGRTRALGPQEVRFEPLKTWISPHTQASYPVSMRLSAGSIDVELKPVMNDQEVDARASTGTVYWEGAVSANSRGGFFGRGYLELTGYWKPLQL